jgi:hypothetical protein
LKSRDSLYIGVIYCMRSLTLWLVANPVSRPIPRLDVAISQNHISSPTQGHREGKRKKRKTPVQLFGVQAPANRRWGALAKGVPRYSFPYPLIIPLFSTHQMGDIEAIAEKARARKKGEIATMQCLRWVCAALSWVYQPNPQAVRTLSQDL